MTELTVLILIFQSTTELPTVAGWAQVYFFLQRSRSSFFGVFDRHGNVTELVILFTMYIYIHTHTNDSKLVILVLNPQNGWNRDVVGKQPSPQTFVRGTITLLFYALLPVAHFPGGALFVHPSQVI